MSAPTAPDRRRARRRLLGIVIGQVILVLAALELGSRIYWRLSYGVPLSRPRAVVRVYYPELDQLDGVVVSDRDATFDIALLGASVLHPNFGDVADRIGREAAALGPRPVRVFNFAMPAQTTLDSRYKRLEMTDRRFDLVIVYHGINDTRANDCPPELFRDDYSHWSWYRYIANYEVHRRQLAVVALPFTLDHLWLELVTALGTRPVIPHDRPPREWFRYGGDLKTRAPFRHNLEQIVAGSGRIVLATFAIYVAPGYSEERFEAGELDYGRHESPIELWGSPANVTAGVEAHNRIVREVGAAAPNAAVLDLATTMPRSGQYFDDVCHLTAAGCQHFAAEILPLIVTAERLPPLDPAAAASNTAEAAP